MRDDFDGTAHPDAGFRAFKLTNHGVVTGSLIAPLAAMNPEALQTFINLLREAANELEGSGIMSGLWPLGRALRLLGFTVEGRDDSDAGIR